MQSISLRPSVALAWQLGVVFAVFSLDLLTQEQVSLIFKEGHSVEVMSAALILVAALLWFGLGAARGQGGEWHIPVILLLMAMRELDFDKRFTSEGVLQLRLYSGPSPLWEKLIGAAVVLLILVCGLRLLMRNVPRWLRGLRQGAATSWLVAGAGTLLVVSKSLDGLGRKLASLGIYIDPAQGQLASRAEELLELAMAVMLVQAVICFSRRGSTGRGLTRGGLTGGGRGI